MSKNSKPAKIESLTPEQEAQLAVYRDRWTRIGLMPLAERGQPNQEELEAIVADLYRAGGLEPPKHTIAVGSLLGAQLAAHLLKHGGRVSVGASVWASVRSSVGASVGESVGESVEASVWDSVGASVGESVGESVEASVRESVGDSVGASVGESVEASVRESVGESVGESVRESVWASVRESVGDSVGASVGDSPIEFHWPIYGAYDAGWCGWAAYCDELGLVDLPSSRPLRRLAEVAGFVVAFKDVCIVSAPHVDLKLDDRGQLHCEDGPAIWYPDGFAVWAIDGVRVPQLVVESPDKITREMVEQEENADIREIMVRRYPGGASQYLVDIGAKVVDTDTVPVDRLSPRSQHITRALVATTQGDRYLVSTDGSTGRVYHMPVEPFVSTCREAHESIAPRVSESNILAES